MDGAQRKHQTSVDWQRRYRELERKHRAFVKHANQAMQDHLLFKQRAELLEGELQPLRRDNYLADCKIDRLEKRVTALLDKVRRLEKQLEAVQAKQPEPVKPAPPAFVKANVPAKPRKRPGREPGHAGAFRPMAQKVDRESDVPLPRNAAGECCCPKCRCQLLKVENLRRIVEDIVPSKPIVDAYNTQRGYCPNCNKVMESRAAEQPPAADIPGPQVGINALAMAAVLRAVYRLPFALTTQLLADMSGLTLSKAAIARQMQRMGRRLEQMTDLIGIRLKLSDAVHMDETSWRVDGKNRWLWTLMNSQYTLFHVDKSRGSQVVKKLLGEVYGGTLHTDFYSAYGEIDSNPTFALGGKFNDRNGPGAIARADLCLKRAVVPTYPLATPGGDLA